jgi:hypothetical protein
MRAFSRYSLRMRALIVGLSLLAGCSFGPHGQQPQPCGGDGVLLISWTMRGQAPSATSCSGIDHLEVDIAPLDCDAVAIAPVSCQLTRFRYDGFPEGPARIGVSALDATGTLVASGIVDVELTGTAPSSPVPIDMQ